jgi:hypothetical protein
VKKSNFSAKKKTFFHAGQHEKKSIWQRKKGNEGERKRQRERERESKGKQGIFLCVVIARHSSGHLTEEMNEHQLFLLSLPRLSHSGLLLKVKDR